MMHILLMAIFEPPLAKTSPRMLEPKVTVIIPTLAEERRAETIWRAIRSAGARSGVPTEIVVVVNGQRFTPGLVADLRAHRGIRCEQIDEESMPAALHYGRRVVTTEFFAFLDDDDEFLEGGLTPRLHALAARPELAFVVTNGVFAYTSHEVPQVGLDSIRIESDPLGSLLEANWVATSASGLYRSSAVASDEFTEVPPFLEWTYLGFRLARRLPFRFLDEPTYRRHDMADGVSKTHAYRIGTPAGIRQILKLSLPACVQRTLRRKLGAAYHDAAAQCLASGRPRAAWYYHLQSLGAPGGLRYTLYTRRLLVPSFTPQNKGGRDSSSEEQLISRV